MAGKLTSSQSRVFAAIYLSKRREQLKMPVHQNALLIFDVFKGQTTQQVKDVILERK